jgi:hypothetical protein
MYYVYELILGPVNLLLTIWNDKNTNNSQNFINGCMDKLDMKNLLKD